MNFPTPTPGQFSWIEPALRPLVAQLEARHPGIAIIDACFRTLDDGTRQQNLRFRAPIEALLAAGLITPAMVEASRDSRRSPQTTPAGCGFHLLPDGLDARSVPGCADLLIFTSAVPRERERFAVKDAVRELRRFTLPRRKRGAA